VHGALRLNSRSAPLTVCATGKSSTYSCFPSSGAGAAWPPRMGGRPVQGRAPRPLGRREGAAGAGHVGGEAAGAAMVSEDVLLLGLVRVFGW
jgi:hypothetical protein